MTFRIAVDGLLPNSLTSCSCTPAVTPHCELCAGVLKPNVVLFGELLPAAVMTETNWQVKQCDLMLVAGSSLEVVPISHLPWEAKRNGARLIIVNYEETYADGLADVVIRANVAEVLPLLAAPFATSDALPLAVPAHE